MRTHYCGRLTAADAGEKVRLAGWVHRRRDHGGVVFFDLRDREGLIQVVLNPDESAAYELGRELRAEYVVAIEGVVRLRPEGSANPDLDTGEVEVAASSVEVLAQSASPPFRLDEYGDVSEETRIRYRYLDLRRPEMLRILRLRHLVLKSIRSYFDSEGFIEVETPLLTKATPEGARDFLVPSRLWPGSFFALPQSPQLFKQLLMIGGVDRYYQIARCFRDEDPRADRQPDFTQLDMEMSFVDESVIRRIAEGMFVRIWRDALGVEIDVPFPEISYEEAHRRYGTDKPDLRFGLEIEDVTSIFASTQARVLRSALDAGGMAGIILVPGAATLSRKSLDELNGLVRGLGVAGLAWFAFGDGTVDSPLRNALTVEEMESLRRSSNASPGDLVLLISAAPSVVRAALGALRLQLAGLLGLIPAARETAPSSWRFTWVTDPPLFTWNEDQGRWDSTHHPFTAPREEDIAAVESDPGSVRARAYDIVLNGWELSTGSIRIHRPELQRKILGLLGLGDEAIERRFGWFLRALDYGAPPHGGIAPGIDRIVARLAGVDNIREVIAFPKSGAYSDPLTGAPDPIDPDQLAELRLAVLPLPEPD